MLINKDELIDWRRHFHMYPELSGKEEKTSEFIAGELSWDGSGGQKKHCRLWPDGDPLWIS